MISSTAAASASCSARRMADSSAGPSCSASARASSPPLATAAASCRCTFSMYGFRFMGAIVAQVVCHRKVNCANNGSGIAAPTACDMKGIADQPQILEALSPSYATARVPLRALLNRLLLPRRGRARRHGRRGALRRHGPLRPRADHARLTACSSSPPQRVIDEEVRRIVDESHEQVIALLQQHRSKLDSLASALLEHETL